MSLSQNKELISLVKSIDKFRRKYGLKKIIKKIELISTLESSSLFRDKIINHIINIVCEEYDISIEELKANKFQIIPHSKPNPRNLAIILCCENIIIHYDELKPYFGIKNKQIIHYAIKYFKKQNRKNKTDRIIFFETYDKLNKKIVDFIKN